MTNDTTPRFVLWLRAISAFIMLVVALIIAGGILYGIATVVF